MYYAAESWALTEAHVHAAAISGQALSFASLSLVGGRMLLGVNDPLSTALSSIHINEYVIDR